MYQRVVVPLDGSTLAETVLDFILQIAGPLDLEVVLVRVVPRFAAETELPEAGPYLERQAGPLAGKGVRVRTEVRRGDPAEEIVAATRDARADLIAMTTRGRGGLARLMLGSVAEAVLRTADVPVFLLRHVERAEVSTPGSQRSAATPSAP